MVHSTVGASWMGLFTIFVFVNTAGGFVPSAAHSTFRIRLTRRLVMPILLTVEASKWFWVVYPNVKSSPYSKVDLFRTVSDEGA